MSSWVLFKFKSSKEPIRITFDGTGITVFELKREIINVSQLGDGADFDLQIYDEGTGDEYDDDTVIVPRASMVIARRLPAARPGHGKAARYVSGRMPATYRRNDQKSSTTSGTDALTAMNNAKTEQERIEAMFAAEGDQWQKQQQEMSHAKPVFFKSGQQKRPAFADKPLPPGYICHRCQQKGHWIYDCPTNDDPTFVPKPKLKKTTGIPRSFLEKIDKSEIIEEDEEGKLPKGYMIDAEGNRVRVKTDTATWEKEQAKQQATAAKKEAAEEENKELKERGLECSIDNRLFEAPTKTPCCSKTYCHTCIEDALVNNDLVCPNCGQENVLIDDLLPDTETALKIKAYRDEKEVEAKGKEAALQKAEAEQAEEARKAAEAAKAAEEAVASVEKVADTESESKVVDDSNDAKDETKTNEEKRSTSPTGSATSQKERASSTESSSKKRRADEELVNDRKSQGPTSNDENQNGWTPQFLQDMEKLSQANLQNSNGMPNMSMPPMMPNMGMGMNMMNNPMMMNPMAMMGMPGLMPNMMNGMGMGMNMPNMMGFSNNGFNNFNNQQGWQGQNQQNNQHNWNGNNFNNQNRGGYQNRGRGNFNNNNNNSGHNPNFNKTHPNEEDSPYLRQPVNPHRHQKQRRMRPSEYRELGH